MEMTGPAPIDSRRSVKLEPGAVLALSVIAIVYGTLAAVWQLGALLGATDRRGWLPPFDAANARIGVCWKRYAAPEPSCTAPRESTSCRIERAILSPSFAR